MKILLIGVSGFIGKKLYQNLTLSHEVYGISNNRFDKKNCFQLDLLKKNSLEIFLKNKSFDVIINLAAHMASTENINDFSLLKLNMKIQMNIINALSKLKCCYFINFSSSAVYPNISGKFDENSIIDPSANNDCLYGLAKFNGEILFNYFFNNKHNLLNLRLGYVHGEGMNKTRIHKVFTRELNDDNQITVWGNGERVIPQISISFLVNYINNLLESRIVGTYNLIEDNSSLLEIAQKIINDLGNSKSKILKIDKGNKEKFKMDSSKIKSRLRK